MDKTETKEGELNPTDAGYKWFTCPTCDGTAKISQDQLEQINKEVESEIQAAIDCGNLRSELQKRDEEKTESYIIESNLLKENRELRSELSKAKELNGELVKIKNLVEELIEVAPFRNQTFTSL